MFGKIELIKAAAIVAVLFVLSTGANIWLLYRLAGAKTECEAKIESLSRQATEKAVIRDAAAAEIGRESKEAVEDTTNAISNATNAASERVRTIIRTVQVPADCPVRLPDGVQRELNQAASAANSRL